MINRSDLVAFVTACLVVGSAPALALACGTPPEFSCACVAGERSKCVFDATEVDTSQFVVTLEGETALPDLNSCLVFARAVRPNEPDIRDAGLGPDFKDAVVATSVRVEPQDSAKPSVLPGGSGAIRVYSWPRSLEPGDYMLIAMVPDSGPGCHGAIAMRQVVLRSLTDEERSVMAARAGSVLLNQGQTNQAATEFLRACHLQPANLSLASYTATLLLQAGDTAGARDLAQRALSGLGASDNSLEALAIRAQAERVLEQLPATH